MAPGRSEDKISIIKSDSLQQQKRGSMLSLQLHTDADDLEDQSGDGDTDGKPLLASSSANLYIDSPRVGQMDADLTPEEITRRKRIGAAAVFGLCLTVMICIALIKYLAEHETFSALPPMHHRFMQATSAQGAKESLEQYTAGNRQTGGTGDYEMAKYIRSKAIDFGINPDWIKIDEFETLVNEPETLTLELPTAGNDDSTIIDLMANFKTIKKSSRVAYPPFHLYSKNGNATGKLVYAHYGTTSDYEALQRANVDVKGCIVLVRLGQISLPAKVIIAGKFGAAGIFTYSDPIDDGVGKGKAFPDGPWRVTEEASFGSVYLGNGDPSAPYGFSVSGVDRITVEEVFSANNTYSTLPQIPSIPVSAKVAQQLMNAMSKSSSSSTLQAASTVFGSEWNGGSLTGTYYTGPSTKNFKMINKNKYSLRKVWNVLITIKGTRESDRYIIVGAQRDAFSAGAVAPGSGNAVFLEMLRGIGDLLTSGWMPHRTLLFGSFAAEQFGSVGSSEWIDRHFTHLGGRGIVYLNLRDVVRGSGPLHCEAAASLRKNIVLMSSQVPQPKQEVNVDSFFSIASTSWFKQRLLTDAAASSASGSDAETDEGLSLLPLNTTFAHEDLADDGESVFSYWLQHTKKSTPSAKIPKIDIPGSSSRVSPFLARLSIPSVELDFDGGYFGVDGSSNDTITWMKKFADPTFTFHRAAAQLYGSVLLSFSDSIFLQYDFTEVARDLRYGEAYLTAALAREGLTSTLPMNRLSVSINTFENAVLAVLKEIRMMSDEMVNIIGGELTVDLKRVREMNTRLLMTEKAFALPEGLPRMPWVKHALYGISEWDDYRAGFFPSITHHINSHNPIIIKREFVRVCQIIEQAADILSTTVL